jgi:hypothetical protein
MTQETKITSTPTNLSLRKGQAKVGQEKPVLDTPMSGSFLTAHS